MARDLIIYGMNFEFSSIGELKSGADIIPYLDNLELDDWERHGVVEIASLRSKDICLAIAQVVADLHKNGFISLGGAVVHREFGENLMVLSKVQILDIVNWLILTSEALGEVTGNIENVLYKSNSDYQAALQVVRRVCVGEEFEWFWLEKALFEKWYVQINESAFRQYYWEDSY